MGVHLFYIVIGREPSKRVRQNPIMNEVQRADFGIFAQQKARQGEEPAAQAMTGDESNPFPALKRRRHHQGVFFVLGYDKSGSRTLEEGSTNIFFIHKKIYIDLL